MLTTLLCFVPVVSADPVDDLADSITGCIPRGDVVSHHDGIQILRCGEVRGGCSYDVVPGRPDPASGGTWGAAVHLDVWSAPGYGTIVSCEGLARVRVLHQGSFDWEPRWADLRLGHIVKEDMSDTALAAREATAMYPAGGFTVLELELEVQAWAVMPGVVPRSDTAELSVPAATYNSEWLPYMSPTEVLYPYPMTPLGGSWHLTDDVPLLSGGPAQRL